MKFRGADFNRLALLVFGLKPDTAKVTMNQGKASSNEVTNPLWITYSWADNDEGDFDYLIQELEKAGIPAIYDKIALVPGRKLWSQIARKITEEPLSGWAYLITPQSLSSAACQEELGYALQRALETQGEEFSLIGLLHQVSIRDVPLALRIRLCVNLANPDWVEEIRAATLGHPPRILPQEQSPLVVKIHKNYFGDPNATAIEFRPRFEELTYWRIAFAADGPHPSSWGSGPANGGGISSMKISSIEGKGLEVVGIQMDFVGAGNALSASTSAYVVFKGQLPDKLFFGVSREPFSTEMSGNVFTISE